MNSCSNQPTRNEMLLLVELFNAGNFSALRNEANNFIKKYPKHNFGWKLLSISQKHFGQLAHALSAAKKAASLAPHDHEIFNIVGVIYGSLDKHDEAISAYKKALSLKPDYPEAFNNLGNLLRKCGLFVEAFDNFQKAIKLKPTYSEAFCNISSTLISQKRYAEAETFCKYALSLNPGFPEALNNLGVIYNSRRDYVNAENAFQEALKINHLFIDAYNNLGSTLQNRGKLEESELNFVKAIELNKNYSEAHFNLAINYFFKNNFKNAENIYKALIKIDPQNNGLKACVDMAILAFLEFDIDVSKQYLKKAKPIFNNITKFKYYVIYWRYIDALLNSGILLMNNHFSKNQTMHVVGESHALASHGLTFQYNGNYHTAKAHWIPGCKQWHFATSESNLFKEKMHIILSSISDNSKVTFSIGEIDCREDDGIMSRHEKYPELNIEALILETVTRYLRYIKGIADKKCFKTIIQGIPAPKISRLEALSCERSVKICNLINSYNKILRLEALRSGMDFLDLYKATNDLNGSSSGQKHVDDYHLKQTAMIDAWSHALETSI